jgi:hypothetical protein
MKVITLVRLVMLGAVLVLVASCTPDGGTIYATIETETKTVDNSLPDTITVRGIVPVAPGGPYYAAAASLYKGTFSGSTMTWSKVTKTTPPGSLVNAIATDGASGVWVGLITSGSVLGLYGSSAPDTVTFTKQADPGATQQQVQALSADGNTPANLFAVYDVLSGQDYEYELEYLSAGTWTIDLLGGLVPDPIVGVATKGVGSYFTASGASIYSATTVATGAFSVSQSLGAGDTAQGIFGDVANGRVFVATKTGGIWYNDGTWHQVKAPVINSVTVPFLSVAGPIDLGTNHKYLVGSDGYGYFTFDITAPAASAFTQFADSTIALYSASISTILVDPTTPTTVFMGTNNAGLWRASFDASTGALTAGTSWTHE